MTTKNDFILAVDAFISAPKLIVGIGTPPQWPPDRNRVGVIAKFPLEVNGVQYGSTLEVGATPAIGAFRILATHCHTCVSRLDFNPDEPHTNTMHAQSDGLPGIVSGKHFHRWTFNKRFVDAQGGLERLRHAEELPPSVRTFDAALRWFCDEMNISLPHNHSIDYPRTLI